MVITVLPKVHSSLVTSRFTYILGKKSIWFIGSSIVYWAQRNAYHRIGWSNLGLQDRGVNIRWSGKSGMLWESRTSSVEERIKSTPPTTFLVLHLGSNDLGTICTKNIIENTKSDVLRLKLLLPNTNLVWVNLLMQRYWHNARDGKKLEQATKRLYLELVLKTPC